MTAAKLQDKFKVLFITPLCISVAFSVLVSAAFLFLFVKNLTRYNTSYAMISEATDNVMVPIIKNAELALSKQFQEPINALLLAKRYFLDTCTSTNKKELNRDKITEFVSNYALSIVNIAKNYNSYNQKFINSSANIMDYGAWIIDNKINNINSLDNSTLNYLYVLAQMNTVFSSINPYSGNATVLGSSTFNLVYVTSPGYNMFYEHRFRTNSPTRYNTYVETTNQSWCKDKNGKIPSYYYFSCRPWFKEVLLMYKNYNLTIAIQPPYPYSTGEIGTTACIRFLDKLTTNNIKDNYIVICVDIFLNTINKFFDYYNNLIYGYFFVTRIKNVVPMYYPRIMGSGTINSLSQYEFGLNLTYYMEEYGYYSNNLLQAFQYSADIDPNTNTKGEFSMGGRLLNYSVFPVYLNLEDGFINKGKYLQFTKLFRDIKTYDEHRIH